MFAFSGAIHFLFFCFFVRFTMNWTFLATWLWWRRRWRWITMTIYSTELFQALSRLLRRRLSCFWFIFYYVSAMFIKRDTVIINKTTFTVMWFFSRVCVCEWGERESRCVCLQGKKKKNTTRLTLFMERRHRLLTMPGSLSPGGEPKRGPKTP